MQSHLVADSERHVTSEYALGYTNAEQDRLIRQATRIAPYTERLFREAGIGPGQHVLDLGSGVGDVSMLVSKLVGPSGDVVGIERDAISIARARARVASAGLHNVTFVQTDAAQIVGNKPFDAVVGRFILMFLPDPVSVLRFLSALVRPGGVLVFQEPTWVPFLASAARLPLWSALLSAIHQTMQRSGVNPEMGPALYRIFQQIGMPAPAMHAEVLMGSDADFTGLICDLLVSLKPLALKQNVSLLSLGDLETLSQRIQAEVQSSNTVVSFVPMVGVWSRKEASS
jgi:ubiquinone/menaquinone biosynthesis C-methylase UbiE